MCSSRSKASSSQSTLFLSLLSVVSMAELIFSTRFLFSLFCFLFPLNQNSGSTSLFFDTMWIECTQLKNKLLLESFAAFPSFFFSFITKSRLSTRISSTISNKQLNTVPQTSINPFPPTSVKWHLQILLCLTPDDFTRQWGTSQGGKG